MSSRIRLRRATLANWVSDNPVLDYGEVGLVYHDSNGKLLGFVTGDGTTVYGSLVMSVPPRAGSVETGHEVTWDVIARLDQGNTFATGNNIFSHDVDIKGMVTLDGTDVAVDETALTVKGKVEVVKDDDAAANPPGLFVDGGDIVLDDDGADPPVGGNVILPQSPTDLASEHALKSADTGEGVVKFTEEGVVVANGGDGVGVWDDGGTDRSGPNITVKTDSVVIGGNKFGATSPLVQPPLTYAAAPAASWDALGDLDVPTKELIESAPSPWGLLYFGDDATIKAATPSWGGDSWNISTLWGTSSATIADWSGRYLNLVFTGVSSTYEDTEGIHPLLYLDIQDSSSNRLNNSWTTTSGGDGYANLGVYTYDGNSYNTWTVTVCLDSPVLTDGILNIKAKRGGFSGGRIYMTGVQWTSHANAPIITSVSGP